MEQVLPVLPVLPIRNAVLFPGVSMPLVVGRGRSIRAIEQSQTAQTSVNLLIVVAQRVMTPGDPHPEDLYSIGTLCKLENSTITEVGSRQVIVTGIARYRLFNFEIDPSDYLAARGELISDVPGSNKARSEALFLNLKEIAKEVVELLPGTTEPLTRLIEKVDDSAYLSNVCAAYLNLPLSEKQELLEIVQIETRMETLLNAMRKEREVLNMQHEIREKMSERLTKAQREALLREQLRTIRTELGEDSGEQLSDDLDIKIRQARLPEEATKQVLEELKRLKTLPPASAEYHVIRTYLEWLAALPWSNRTESPIDLRKARTILDEDHYGLEEVKKRILQYLAVAKLKNDIHGPILCLVGPPGVGKTSLGQSIARALDRKFIRTSLGGVRDEAEIRGHRRTYVGSMPGRIIQSLKRVGTKNPVMMLDEIDKLRSDFHGDPSSAMLEVLDPEQNKTFTDHYIDIPFDLSEVFFITTANVVDTIPAPLRDRMEIIEVNSYTTFEKLEIAKKYLVSKQLKEHGLTPKQINLPETSLKEIISHYTREAGVRELQRKIAALFRATAEKVVEQQEDGDSPQSLSHPIDLSLAHLTEYLGPPRFLVEMAERIMRPGIATGIAWTPHGGDLLFIEATAMPGGKGHLLLTGQLGDVMKESAQIAVSLARTLNPGLSSHKLFDFNLHDIHIHVPAGAISKDGPSAGITLLLALVSLILGQPIDSHLGMTGEITLRGAILPVGGIKEKVLAAHRGGLKRVLIPKKNQADLIQIPQEIRSQIHLILYETAEEAIRLSFTTQTQDTREDSNSFSTAA